MSHIDPQAKIARYAREKAVRAAKARARQALSKKRKTTRLTLGEMAIISHFATETPAPTPTQINQLSSAMQRRPETILASIRKAKESFQANAQKYVEAHAKVLDDPMADSDVKRKAAQWAMEHLSAKDSKGNVERIIESEAQSDSGVKVQIGIALGGIGNKPDYIEGESTDE